MTTTEKIAPQIFKLRTPLLQKGRSHRILAETDLMNVAIKCYAEGGENVLHTHPNEDHVFVVLDGKVRFYDRDGDVAVLERNQAILAPKGWFYWFENCGDRPLVMLRIGAAATGPRNARFGADGKPLPGESVENKWEAPVPIEGAFYE